MERERTFKQELGLAMNWGLNILKLNIANEVSEQLVNSYWWIENEVENGSQEMDEMFENICWCVYNIYLKIDNTYSLANVVEAVIKMNIENKVPINEINKYMVIGYIQDNL